MKSSFYPLLGSLGQKNVMVYTEKLCHIIGCSKANENPCEGLIFLSTFLLIYILYDQRRNHELDYHARLRARTHTHGQESSTVKDLVACFCRVIQEVTGSRLEGRRRSDILVLH